MRASDYFVVRQLLIDAGIPFAEARPVATEEAAVAAADEIGYPIVLKALGMTHKSDVGGVRLDLRTDDEVRAGYVAIVAVRDGQPPATREAAVLVQRMVPGGVELGRLAGKRRGQPVQRP